MPNNWQVFHLCTIDVYFQLLMFQHCLNILLFTRKDSHVPICIIHFSTFEIGKRAHTNILTYDFKNRCNCSNQI